MSPADAAYWKRFGTVFQSVRKELLRQQLFAGSEFQVRRSSVAVAAGLADALCETEGLGLDSFKDPSP